MSDVIYYKNGEETFRISPPTVETKCPETKLEVKKMNEIQKTEGEIKVLQAKLELLKEMENHKSRAEVAYKDWEGKYPGTEIWTSDDDMRWVSFAAGYNAAQKDYKVGEYQPTPQEPKENKWKTVALLFGKKLPVIPPYGYDELSPDAWFRWVVFTYDDYIGQRDIEIGYHPAPWTPEQTEKSLREAFKKVQQTEEWKETQRKIDSNYEEKVEEEPKPMNEVLGRLENKYKDAEENAASYMTDEVVNRMLKKWEENPPEFLKFELGKTLEGLISDWMDDCVPAYSTWDYELGIAILIRRIEKWLPDFQSSSGSQNVDTELLVDGYNDALTKIKSKLRNKKDT